ncbi:MAG: hypothetical protein IT381_13090 [Deltaproteobacteria bacterium]|nr:hypothetical protein [Deltaproteobacteria bacterium]
MLTPPMFTTSLASTFDRAPISVPLAIACAFGLMGALSGLPSQPDHEFHLFVASHYEHAFFSLYEPRWYGGFYITGHPPLLHALTAILGRVPGLGIERAYAIILAAIPMGLVVAAWMTGGVLARGSSAAPRASLLVALNPLVYLLLIPFGQAPFVLAVALGLLSASSFLEGRTGVAAGFGAAAAACHPLGLLLPLAGVVVGLARAQRIRVAIAAVAMLAVSFVTMWPFFAGYVYGLTRVLPKNPLSLASGTSFAIVAAMVLGGVALFVAVDKKSSRNARGLGIAGLALAAVAHFGVGPVYWDKLLFFSALATALALALDLSRRLSSVVLLLVMIAASYALSLKKPGRTRDQRAALVETSAFLAREGHDRFRYMTVGLGKEALEIGRRTAAGSIDGGMPWLKTLPELDAQPFYSLDELPLDDARARSVLEAVLARADALHLAWLISADGRAGEIAARYGYATLAAFPGGVVLYQKEVTPLVAATPAPPVWAKGLPVRGWGVLWSLAPLLVLACSIGAFSLRLLRARSSS